MTASMSPSTRSMTSPGAVLAVPGEVERQGVAAQVDPQAVADPPGQTHRQPGDDELEPVGHQEEAAEDEGDPGEGGGGGPVGGLVDEPPQQQLGHDGQPHGHDEEDGQPGDAAPLRAQLPDEEPGPRPGRVGAIGRHATTVPTRSPANLGGRS